jgi:hypothetical protein
MAMVQKEVCMQKSFVFIGFSVMVLAIAMALAGCGSTTPTPTPTGNSSEIRDVLSGKIFLYRSAGFVRESWYLTFNYDGTYIQTTNGMELLKGSYSLSGTRVNLTPAGIPEGADVLGQLHGTLDSAENPTRLKWNMSVYKLVQ